MARSLKTVRTERSYIDDLSLRPELAGDGWYKKMLAEQGSTEYIDTFTRSVLREDGTPLCVIGVNPLFKGCADVWAFVAGDVRDYAKPFYEQLVDLEKMIVALLELHRLQASVRAEFEIGKQFLLNIGWQQEGILHSYQEIGVDYLQFARIYDPPGEVTCPE